MGKSLILVGASGLAREVMVAVAAVGEYDIEGIVDDDTAVVGTTVGRAPVIGPMHRVLEHPRAEVLICVGSGRSRDVLVRRLAEIGVGEERFGTIIHPGASVPSNCVIGGGSVLLAGVVLTTDVTVGRHVVAMPSVVLTHDSVVGDFATLCAGVVLGGGVRIGERAYLGMNSSVRQNLQVGRDSTLGMGSALIHDLPERETWAGVPARSIAPAADQERLVADNSGPQGVPEQLILERTGT